MLYPEIERFLETLPSSVRSKERAEKWDMLAENLDQNRLHGAINFICTHNARRSILSQSLATVLIHKYGLSNIKAWSGGAEETFVHPNSIAALQRIGFRLIKEITGNNPHYFMAYSEDAPLLELFSKKFDDPTTPAPYHAILVCSKGDVACPFIPNVGSRTLIPFEDPGAFDDTPQAEKAYDETAKIIGQELSSFFSALAKP